MKMFKPMKKRSWVIAAVLTVAISIGGTVVVASDDCEAWFYSLFVRDINGGPSVDGYAQLGVEWSIKDAKLHVNAWQLTPTSMFSNFHDPNRKVRLSHVTVQYPSGKKREFPFQDGRLSFELPATDFFDSSEWEVKFTARVFDSRNEEVYLATYEEKCPVE